MSSEFNELGSARSGQLPDLGSSVQDKVAARPLAGSAAYKRLLTHALAYWGTFVVAITAMVFYAATDTAFAALMKPMLDGSFVDKDPQWIKYVPLLLLTIFLVRGVSGFLSSYCMSWIGWKVIAELRGELFAKLLQLPTSVYDGATSGELIAKLTYNVEQVAGAATSSLTILVRDTLTVLGLLGWMFYLNGYLSLGFLVIGPFIAVVVVIITKQFRRISHKIQRSVGRVTHVIEEVIEGHKVVKIFGGQEYEKAHFAEVNERNRRLRMRMTLAKTTSVPLIQFLVALVLAAIVYLATLDSMIQQVSVGTFVSFITAMVMLFAPLKRLTTVNAELQNGIAAGQSIFELLDSAPEPDTAGKSLDRARGAIEFRQVSFAYQADKGQVLRDLSFRVRPGETLAIVGRSGSGKTTLVNLLARFYVPQSGGILLDGLDVRDYSLVSLRDQIAYVGQDVTLFNDTIAKNIAYGRLEGSSAAEIEAAARAAHASEFIDRLPEGYETLVGENGVLLSGGQRQRLAIARALLKNAPILILDEATSALDTESERHVQAGLEELLEDRTTLVIAHRLSTVEKADTILMLHDGRLLETGTHHELLARDGAYAKLYRMQFDADQGPILAAKS